MKRSHAPALSAAVLRLSSEGRSSREIGIEVGLTRNAVLGIVFRSRVKAGHVPQPGAPRKPTEPTRTRGDGCRWPIGHPGDAGFRFCREPRQGAKPYCDRHSALAYQPRSGN